MDYKDIKKLMDDMGESKIDSLEIEFPEGVKIKMKKNIEKEVIIKEPKSVIEASAPMTTPVITKKPETPLLKEDVKKDSENEEENFKIIKSPMVGTFYASSSPEKEPFVKLGDKVHKGQVLCIVEAMKLMNEIESEYDGEIVEICVNNEDIVEYGTPLFKIR